MAHRKSDFEEGGARGEGRGAATERRVVQAGGAERGRGADAGQVPAGAGDEGGRGGLFALFRTISYEGYSFKLKGTHLTQRPASKVRYS